MKEASVRLQSNRERKLPQPLIGGAWRVGSERANRDKGCHRKQVGLWRGDKSDKAVVFALICHSFRPFDFVRGPVPRAPREGPLLFARGGLPKARTDIKKVRVRQGWTPKLTTE
ncbi:hypothetical protein TNCV_4007131 [Trichonephila clavipes]|uniref:Uncharacterized protein n=1 Tax=Trichonephila clavata TaxID=2740835 RepID=A0A8X6J228_TRICU|nr:hypothetical protein TNCT_198601 [Trichonephila clavata]GFW18173.1 hypothetical protein TNCV_4007131 [Trichonephila clavipes]